MRCTGMLCIVFTLLPLVAASRRVKSSSELKVDNGDLAIIKDKERAPLSSDLTMTIPMTVTMTVAKDEAFADTLSGLSQIFEDLGMPEKFAEVEGKVASKVKKAMMTKVPVALADKMAELGVPGVQATAATEPQQMVIKNVFKQTEPEEAGAAHDQIDVAPHPDYEMFFRVVVHDRDVVVEHLDPSPLAKVSVKNMPQVKFLELIRHQLEEKVSASVAETVGDGFQITVSTEADVGAEEASARKSFWLLVKVGAVDVDALLENNKGRDFADNFNQLVESLQELRLPHSDVLINNIHRSIDTKAMGGIGDVLPQKLSQAIGVKVWSVSKRGYFSLKSKASEGRCCVGESNGESVAYWVPNNLARGAGALGLGYGRDGHCPLIQEGTGCVAKGYSETRVAIATAHTSYTDCFVGGGSGGDVGVPTSYIAAYECSE